MKRFYKDVDILERDDKYYVTLDGNIIKTPHKSDLSTDNISVAKAMQQEWAEVEETIDAEKMPVTKYINTLIDRIAPQREQMNALLVEYIHHDSLCYFSGDADTEFNAIQEQKWLPVIHRFNQKFNLDIQTTTGIMPLMQNEDISTFAQNYAQSLSPLEFIVFYQLVTLTGSFILGTMVLEADMPEDEALSLSQLEEDRNIQKWGEDPETEKNRNKKKSEWDGVLKLWATITH